MLGRGRGVSSTMEIKAQVVGKRLMGAECPAWSAVASQQPREAHVQMGRLRRKGVRSLVQDHPVKAKVLGCTMAPTHDLSGFVP